MVAEQTVGEGKLMDQCRLGTAGEQRLAVGRKAQAVEGLVEEDAGGLLCAAQVHDDDFVIAVAGVEGGEPFAAGVQGEVDGEVAEQQRFAGRPQRPLVGQLDDAAGLEAGQETRRPLGPGRALDGGPIHHGKGQTDPGNQQQSGSEQRTSHGAFSRARGAASSWLIMLC